MRWTPLACLLVAVVFAGFGGGGAPAVHAARGCAGTPAAHPPRGSLFRFYPTDGTNGSSMTLSEICGWVGEPASIRATGPERVVWHYPWGGTVTFVRDRVLSATG